MFDWISLWHAHEDQRVECHIDHNINELGEELNGPLIQSASDGSELAVYDTGTTYTLVGQDKQSLEMLSLKKQDLFDISVHFVTNCDEECKLEAPYIEVWVDNLATSEEACWQTPVRQDEEGQIWIDKSTLEEGIVPFMPFDELSFTDSSRFRDGLYDAWRNSLVDMTPSIRLWFRGQSPAQIEQVDSQATAASAYSMDARTEEMLTRYAEIIRREQLLLSRQFSDNELRLVAAVLQSIQFEDAASCRGLWLAVEARILNNEYDHQYGVEAEPLLNKLKTLNYTQEVALIEALSTSSAQDEQDLEEPAHDFV